MKFGSPLVRRALGSVLNVLKQDQFIKSTVRKVLFGISNPLLKLGNDVLPEEKKYPFPLFGLFVGVSYEFIVRSKIKLHSHHRTELHSPVVLSTMLQEMIFSSSKSAEN